MRPFVCVRCVSLSVRVKVSRCVRVYSCALLLMSVVWSQTRAANKTQTRSASTRILHAAALRAHVCKLPDAAVALIEYPILHAEQSTSPSLSHSVPPLPVATVGVPFGHVQMFAAKFTRRVRQNGVTGARGTVRRSIILYTNVHVYMHKIYNLSLPCFCGCRSRRTGSDGRRRVIKRDLLVVVVVVAVV
jgi:hypothetical protein